MQKLIWALDERLADAGATLSVAGCLDEASYTVGDRELALPEGISYDLMLTNAGEGIFATGMLHAHVVGTCDRCLDEAAFDIDAEVDEYYLFEMPDVSQYADDEDEADFSLVAPDHTIDLSEALSTALIMEPPYVSLCQEECLGLCPACGANLNHEDCGHAAQLERQRAQERLEASPFAALKALKLDE